MKPSIPLARFKVGQRVYVTPVDLELGSFHAWVTRSHYDPTHREIFYWVAESPSGSAESGDWGEDELAEPPTTKSDTVLPDAIEHLRSYAYGPDDGDVGRTFQERIRVVLEELERVKETIS